MRHIFVIGNGFDLAHGLPTSYGDFILWLVKKEIQQALIDNSKLFFFSIEGEVSSDFFEQCNKIDNLTKLMSFCNRSGLKITTAKPFFTSIFRDYLDHNWVDIERMYFEMLESSYNNFAPSGKFSKSHIRNIELINETFLELKNRLIEYLNTLPKAVSPVEDIEENFHPVNDPRFPTVDNPRIILNFNYTQTFDKYIDLKIDKVFNIHGTLFKPKNIIFGYGDEKDALYHKLENENLDEFLINFKSFGYFKTNVYQNFIDILKGEEYTIHLMGHSCGLSDKVLLQNIFEHPNCRKIHIYYYDTPKYDDHFNKTIAISRHFSPEKKGEMRMKIVPKDESIPLVTFNPKT